MRPIYLVSGHRIGNRCNVGSSHSSSSFHLRWKNSGRVVMCGSSSNSKYLTNLGGGRDVGTTPINNDTVRGILVQDQREHTNTTRTAQMNLVTTARHDQMLRVAKKLLLDISSCNDDNRTISLLSSSSSTLTNDAQKVIRYFNLKKYHGLELNLPSQGDSHCDADATGAMLAKQVLDKLLHMEQEQATATSDASATTHVSQQMFTHVIYGLSSIVTTNVKEQIYYNEQAMDVLKKFQQWTLARYTTTTTTTKTTSIQDDNKRLLISSQQLIAFNMVLKTLVSVGTVEAAQAAQDMLFEQSELYDMDTTGLLPRPDTISFNTTLRAWSQAAATIASSSNGRNVKNTKRSSYCAEKAEELLRFMESMNETTTTTTSDATTTELLSSSSLSPNRSSYNIVIDAWARVGNVERVESLVKHMERASSIGSTSKSSDIYPCRKTFKSVIRAYKVTKEDTYKKVAHVAAMNMLRYLEDLNEKFYNDVRPDADVLNDVIHSWLESKPKDAPFQIDLLVERMEQLYQAGDYHIQPTILTYKMAIKAWKNSVSDAAAATNNTKHYYLGPIRAERHLRQMIKLEDDAAAHLKNNNHSINSNNNNKDYALSSDDFDAVLYLYSACGMHSTNKEETLGHATSILTLLQKCCTSGMPWVKPTFHTYKYMFDIWSHSKDPDRGRRCEEFLSLMESMPQNGHHPMSPTSGHYIRTIEALLLNDNNNNNNTVDSTATDAAWSAEAVLQRMVDKYKAGNSRMKPQYNCYISVAKALRNLRTRAARERSKALYMQSYQHVELEGSKIVEELDTLMEARMPLERKKLIRCSQMLAELGGVNHSTIRTPSTSVEMAQLIFRKVDKLSQTVVGSERPDTIMINTLLRICSKCDDQGAQKAQAFLDTLEEREIHEGRTVLDRVSYCTVLKAWGKSNDKARMDNMSALLHRLEDRWAQESNLAIKPDLHVYGCAFIGMLHAMLPNSTEMAQRVFDKMIAAGIAPDPMMMNQLVQMWCTKGASERAELVMKSSESIIIKSLPAAEKDKEDYSKFRTLALRSILKSYLRRPDGAEQAEKILRQMLVLCDASKPWTAPTDSDITSVLNAYSKSNSDPYAQRACALLDHMIERHKGGALGFAPSKEVVDNVLHSLANSRANDKGEYADIGEKAEFFLKQMEQPDQHSYSLALLAWSHSKKNHGGERAQLLFDQMCQSCNFLPEPRVYLSLLDAWAKGTSKEKEEKAQLVLTNFIEKCSGSGDNMYPTVNHFNSVLTACVGKTSPENSHTALKVATAVFRTLHDEISSSIQPNEDTYRMMFQVCRYVDDDEKRDKLCAKLFQETCRRGLLSLSLYDIFREVSSVGMQKRYLSGFQKVSSKTSVFSSLPPEWRCNAKPGERVVLVQRKRNEGRKMKF